MKVGTDLALPIFGLERHVHCILDSRTVLYAATAELRDGPAEAIDGVLLPAAARGMVLVLTTNLALPLPFKALPILLESILFRSETRMRSYESCVVDRSAMLYV